MAACMELSAVGEKQTCNWNFGSKCPLGRQMGGKVWIDARTATSA
jgi:hypothetical protein